MIVRGDSVEAREIHGVLAGDLAEFGTFFAHDTFLGEVMIDVEDVELHGIGWVELSGVELEVAEDASSLPDSGHVSAADVGTTVTLADALVLPAIDLRDGHDILDAHALIGRDLGNLADRFVLDAEALVQGLIKEDVSALVVDVLGQLEHDRDKLLGNKRWPVVVSCIDPAKHKVVETVRKSFSLQEEILSLLLIEFGP